MRVASWALIEVALICVFGALPASAADDLDARIDAKFEELRQQGRAAALPLQLYPEDFREAMLQVSGDPALVVRLLDAENDKKKLELILADYPEKVQVAAMLIAREREVLSVLSHNLVLVGLIGSLYHDDPEGTKRLLKERAAKGNAKQDKALEAWQKRLEENPEAAEQLAAAKEAYAKEQATPKKKTTASTTPSGMATSISGATVVYAEPSYSFSIYVMDHCDVYWSACGHMYYHHVDWDDVYDDYWDGYWENRSGAREDWQSHLDESREDRQEFRKERREETGDLERAGTGGMSKAMEDWKAKNGDSLSKDFFAKDGKLEERMRGRGEARRGTETPQGTQAKRREIQNRASTRSSVSPRSPTVSATPTRVERGSLNRSQRMERAQRAHHSSWGGRSGASRGGMSRGGMSRGGGGRGGGRRR